MTAYSADGQESVKTALNNNDVAAAVPARQIKPRIEETMVPGLGELPVLAVRLRLSAASIWRLSGGAGCGSACLAARHAD